MHKHFRKRVWKLCLGEKPYICHACKPTGVHGLESKWLISHRSPLCIHCVYSFASCIQMGIQTFIHCYSLGREKSRVRTKQSGQTHHEKHRTYVHLFKIMSPTYCSNMQCASKFSYCLLALVTVSPPISQPIDIRWVRNTPRGGMYIVCNFGRRNEHWVHQADCRRVFILFPSKSISFVIFGTHPWW